MKNRVIVILELLIASFLITSCASTYELPKVTKEIDYTWTNSSVIDSLPISKGLSSLFNDENIDVLGGPDQSMKTASFFEQSVGVTLCSPIATASTRDRHQKRTGNMQSGLEAPACRMPSSPLSATSVSKPLFSSMFLNR